MTFVAVIAGVTPSPEVYGGLTAATARIGARLGDAAAKWRALLPDDQGRTLNDATQYLERLSWAGTANQAGGTTLAWPRSGVLVGGVAVDPTTVPAAIVNACFELAMLFADDPDLQSAADQSSNVAELGAGSGRVRFFNPTSTSDGSATKLPYVVQQLVSPYLGGGAVPTDPGLSGGGRPDSSMLWWRDLNRRDPY